LSWSLELCISTIVLITLLIGLAVGLLLRKALARDFVLTVGIISIAALLLYILSLLFLGNLFVYALLSEGVFGGMLIFAYVYRALAKRREKANAAAKPPKGGA